MLGPTQAHQISKIVLTTVDAKRGAAEAGGTHLLCTGNCYVVAAARTSQLHAMTVAEREESGLVGRTKAGRRSRIDHDWRRLGDVGADLHIAGGYPRDWDCDRQV